MCSANDLCRWVHTVLQVKEPTEEAVAPVILCTSQILSSEEAAVMRANSWLYHYYMVQSRLQYGLAYGAHSPASLSSLYYPHMAGQYYEPPVHPAYLQAAAPLPYPHYPYTPPVGYYPDHPPAIPDTKDPSQGPLDFSKGPPGPPREHWDYPRPQDLSSKSPSWKSESSGSPLDHPEPSSYPAFHPPREVPGAYYPTAWNPEGAGKLKKEVQEVQEGYSDRNNNPHCL